MSSGEAGQRYQSDQYPFILSIGNVKLPSHLEPWPLGTASGLHPGVIERPREVGERVPPRREPIGDQHHIAGASRGRLNIAAGTIGKREAGQFLERKQDIERQITIESARLARLGVMRAAPGPPPQQPPPPSMQSPHQSTLCSGLGLEAGIAPVKPGPAGGIAAPLSAELTKGRAIAMLDLRPIAKLQPPAGLL
jgi:hypothetical protein